MDEQTLLAKYVKTRDAAAFEELTRRYSGLVKGVCLNILTNSHDAEEVTQECFLELARHAKQIHTSLGGWLHRTATSRSLNALRSRVRRRLRERERSQIENASEVRGSFEDAELLRTINTAIGELPEELRLPMSLHFFDGRSQRDVALQLGLNQSTISRRMRDALVQLRQKLTQAGYAASAPAMMILMGNPTISAKECGSTPVVPVETAERFAWGSTLAGAAKSLVASLLPVIAYLLFGGWISLLIASGVVFSIAKLRPVWFAELMSSMGSRDIYHQPTFFLNRWDWKSPPTNWRSEVVASLLGSAMYAVLVVTYAVGQPTIPWGMVVLGSVVASAYFVHSLRLVIRVMSCQRDLPKRAFTSPESDRSFFECARESLVDDATCGWFDVVQLLLIGCAAIGIVSLAVVQRPTGIVWSAVYLSGMVGSALLIVGARLCYRLLLVRHEGHIDVDDAPSPVKFMRGTQAILAIGMTTIVALSVTVVYNPSAIRGLSLSLAALQTSILGWLVYRLAVSSRAMNTSFVRRIAMIVLGICFVLNSGVCFANWLQ